jgi:tetratricopeptide (TPR) repeat protein
MEPDPAKLKRLDIKYNKALKLADEDVKKPVRLTDVGDLFMEEYQESFSNDLLERAIAIYEAAIKLTPDDNEDKAELLIRLGLTLGHRFEYFGDITDIDKAISTFERSLILSPNGDADKPDRLHNLGSSFLTRFEHFGDLADGDRAISTHEQAVNLTPDGHDDKPCYLSDLGKSLSRRFEHSGDLAGCDRAILVQEQAVSIAPNGDDDISEQPWQFLRMPLRTLRRPG